MSARLELCLALALLLAAAGHAGADPLRASVGSADPVTGSTPTGGYSVTESATQLPSGADAYDEAATTDPYNQRDFNPQQSFGLTASQMLGAAAACEQLHSDIVSGRRAPASNDSSDEARASLDAAQQHMLDPATVSPNALRAGEIDCDRVSGAFNQLQQIPIGDQDLAKALGQPDAASPSPDNGDMSSAPASSSAIRSLQPR